MTTDPSTSTLYDLYHSGAYLCLGILAVYFLLKYLSTSTGRVGTWLKVPGRAHYVTAAIGVIGLFMGPLSQGTTPNAMMFFTSMPAIFALLLPGAPKKTDTAPSQAGFVTVGLLIAIAIAGAVAMLLLGCATSSRNKALGASVATLDAAEVGLHAYCHQHTEDTITADKAAGKTADAAQADIVAFRAKCDKAQADIDGAYRTSTAAGVANDSPSLATFQALVKSILAELTTIGVTL